MCTLAVLPDDGGGYLLGHNRDERRDRPRAEPPAVRRLDGRTWLAPRDPRGGGSWIGSEADGTTWALLNGAERDRSRRLEEPPSRGELLFHLVGSRSGDAVDSGLAALQLERFRAFELVAVFAGRDEGARIRHWRWDGVSLVGDASRGASLYVSSSLDALRVSEVRRESWERFRSDHPSAREAELSEWLAEHDPRPGPFTICMHREEAATVSRTLVRVDDREVRMSYHGGPPCRPADEVHVRLERTPRQSR